MNMDSQLELNQMLHSQLVTVEDRTSKGLISPKELFNAIWAVNYQVMFHYSRSRWVQLKLAPAGHMMPLTHGSPPPKGAWNIILLDNADQASALGWHDDEHNDIPYAEVFVQTCRDDNVPWSEVLSHEVLEMLVDPFVDPTKPRTAHNPQNNKDYIVEVGDPVQGFGYDVGDPENRHVGVTVADFALPAWWQLDAGVMKFSYRNSVHAPWEIGPQGYMSITDPGSENWEQVFGEMRNEHPAWASRLPRVHNA